MFLPFLLPFLSFRKKGSSVHLLLPSSRTLVSSPPFLHSYPTVPVLLQTTKSRDQKERRHLFVKGNSPSVRWGVPSVVVSTGGKVDVLQIPRILYQKVRHCSGFRGGSLSHTFHSHIPKETRPSNGRTPRSEVGNAFETTKKRRKGG